MVPAPRVSCRRTVSRVASPGTTKLGPLVNMLSNFVVPGEVGPTGEHAVQRRVADIGRAGVAGVPADHQHCRQSSEQPSDHTLRLTFHFHRSSPLVVRNTPRSRAPGGPTETLPSGGHRTGHPLGAESTACRRTAGAWTAAKVGAPS